MSGIVINSGGLGAVIAANGDFSYPWYCNYLPALFTGQDCAPATPAQIAASNNDLNPATVPNAAAADAANAAAAAATACQLDPDGCAQYNMAITNPGISDIFGTGAAGQSVAGVSNSLSDLTNSAYFPWVVGAVAVLGFILLVKK